MRSRECRQVVGSGRVRLGRGKPVAARLGAIGPRALSLGLREADAVLLREGAAAGEEIAVGLLSDRGETWLSISDLRFGPAYGGGNRAVRRVFLTPAMDIEPEPLTAGLSLLITAVDAEGVLRELRSHAAPRRVEFVPTDRLRDSRAVGALLLGCGSEGTTRAQALIHRFPSLRPVLFDAAGRDPKQWAELVDSGEVFFACRGWPGAEQLGPLVRAAAQDAWFRWVFRELCPKEETEDGLPASAWYDPALLWLQRETRHVLGDLGARAEQRLAGTAAAVYALDEWAEALIGPRPVQDGAWADSSAVGLTALAARAGITVWEEQVEESPFFDADLDLASGAGHALLAVPVRDLAGTVLGVVALRAARQDQRLRPELVREAKLLAADLAPALLSLREESRRQEYGGTDRSLFRTEAIEQYRRSESPSAILNVSERRGPWIVGGLLAFLLAFGMFLVFGKASQYAEGSAVVRSLNRIPVVANVAGTVAAVHLVPGAPVSAGDVIGTLYDAAELAQVERLANEYEDALVRLLRNPEDVAEDSRLAVLRSTSEAARAALEQRQFTALVDGTLADMRVRVGALVSPGQTVATIRTGEAGFEIVAAVHGNFRPLLRTGIPVVAELDQFPGSRLHLKASFVNPEVVGAEEARALVGPLLLPPGGEERALVLVHAELPEVLTSSTGQEHPLYDGMRGRVRIPVREERFIVALWPARGRGE